MTTPQSPNSIAVSQINSELSRPSESSADLNWLTGYIKPQIRPSMPNMNSFYNLAYFARSIDGNCNNGNVSNCNCNCGNIQCSASANCSNINCANCESTSYLQANCNCACTYNCTSNANCFSYNCNCSKIICTKLFQIGMLDKDVYIADQEFGQWLNDNHPDVYNGYIAWAQIVVDWMDGNGPAVNFWVKDKTEQQLKLAAWATRWSKEIATPWAEWMAHKMGIKEQTNYTGLVLMSIGAPISKVVGFVQRKIGKSNKPAGIFTGLALVGIFAILLGIVKVGKLFERKGIVYVR
jgi:hypothetical protein